MAGKKLCFDILSMRHKGFRVYQDLFSEVLRRYQLTQMEMDILLFLANNPEYDTASEIVRVRQLTKSHVSVSIEQLVQKGMLSRNHDRNNRRVTHLALLPEAEPIVEDGRRCQREFTELLSFGIEAEKLETAEEVMQQMMENMKSYRKKKEEKEDPEL
ncbi:MAG: MarR family transcriptional regulator [Firmicutes bacterium]|nr:MarR family transcriptional regulator [Bacillota bacterium]